MKTPPTNGSESAFPLAVSENTEWHQVGLNKREYFAAMAMQGMQANSSIDLDPLKCGVAAVAYADALIDALNYPGS